LKRKTESEIDLTAEKSRGRALTAQAVTGFLWMFSGAGAQAVLKIAVLAVLARLLTPVEFGIVSAALVVVALAELFGQVGVAPAIVQAADLDEAMIRSGSTITIISGLLSGMCLFFGAPFVADLLRISDVEPLIQALSLIFVISGSSLVPEALLQREMRFRTIALVGLGSYLFGYAFVAVTMALAGWGYWALVWAQIAQTMLTAIAFIALRHPPMRPMLHLPSLKKLFRFGAGVMLSRIGNYVAINADYFIVGRWLGATALGFYSRAYVLLVQPAQLVGSVGEKVLFPALSSVQDDNRLLLRGYYRAVALIAMVAVPLSGVLIILAPELIQLLLGPRWDAAILPFQILLCSLFFRTAYKVTGTLLRSRGSVYLLASWQWAYAGMVTVGALVGSAWGIVGVATGVSIAIFAAFWIGAAITRLSSPTSLSTIAGIVVRHATATIVVVIPVYLLHEWLVGIALHNIPIVIACSALAGMIFLAEFMLVPKLFGEEGAWIRSLVMPLFAAIRK
jgi:O-antigen/teichoic acid export membrane protein